MLLRAQALTEKRPSMLRPTTFRAALLTAGLALAAGIVSPTLAQTRADADEAAGGDAVTAKEEVLIGTFALKPKPAPVPPPLPGATEAPASSPADIYADAVRLLQAGDVPSGQRQLEQLVARFPSSGEARLARLRLARLYAGQDPGDTGRPEKAAATAEEASPPEPGEWSAEVRPPSIGEENLFRMEVGDRVFFVAGSAELGSRARSVLAAQAAWLAKQAQLDAVIEGHADDPGSTDENRAVALARAEAVRQRLIEEGIAPERLRTVSVGRGRRVAECDGAECATNNRRAVTLVYPRGSEPPGSRLGANGRGDGSTLSADLPGTRRARR